MEIRYSKCASGIFFMLFVLHFLIIWFSIQIGRLHCSLPWWEDALVNFMISGGYNVVSQIEHVCADLLNFLKHILNRQAFCHFFFASTLVSSNIFLPYLIDNDWITKTSNIEFYLTSFILTWLLFGHVIVGVQIQELLCTGFSFEKYVQIREMLSVVLF